MAYNKYFNVDTRNVAVTTKVREDQVQNDSGGYAFGLDVWGRLRRFLILGSDNPTYYVNSLSLTLRNLASVKEAIALDGVRVVHELTNVSLNNLAPRVSSTLLVLAACFSLGDAAAKREAEVVFNSVVRTGSHLMEFVSYVDAMRSWGRALRRVVGGWYASQEPENLAYQMVKYRNRNGWTHRDILRQAHPFVADPQRQALFAWAVGKGEAPLAFLGAAEYASSDGANRNNVIAYIDAFGLTREMINPKFLNDPDIWLALLDKMPMTAMVRNLGKMGSVGILARGSVGEKLVLARLMSEQAIRQSRIHPLSLLIASHVYGQGHGERGGNSWTVNQKIAAELEDAFYLAFPNLEPINKRVLVALDISASMTYMFVSGMSNMSARDAASAMVLVTNYQVQQGGGRADFVGFSRNLIDMNRDVKESGTSVRTLSERVGKYSFGSTDCSLPMRYAADNMLKYDAFVVYTDNETNTGTHPHLALEAYRRISGVRDAKLIVAGMVANNFTIADPNDPGMLDVVGFDASAPAVMSAFIDGKIS